MITAQHIEARLTNLDYTKPVPSREWLEELMSDGRTRILKASERNGLCPDSVRYFEFCLSQVGSFCAASYNAVEIGLVLDIQPIYIAAAISLHGADWSHRFLGLKRFANLNRGPYTVWKSADMWFVLGEARRRITATKGSADISQGQIDLRRAVRNSDIEFILDVARRFPFRMGSIMSDVRGQVYVDPRLEKAKKAKEKAKADAAAEGKKLCERGAFNDLGNTFNRTLGKSDKTRPVEDYSETRVARSGRRFHA